MALFERNSIKQDSSPFLHYLLLIIIVMEFIRLPNVPFTEFRPVYLIVYFCVLIVFFDFKKVFAISPIVIKVILLLLVYDLYRYLLAWSLDILDEKLIDIRTVVSSIRKFVILLLFSIACTKLSELKRVIFTISITIFISSVFGLLIHYFGEPFQGIRDWLWQSKTDYLAADYSLGRGKDDYVTGLSGTTWGFGYLMSAGPALALIYGRLSRFKWLWVVVFLLMCFALYLNGERAAFLTSCFAVVSLLLLWRLVNIPSICIGIAIVLSIYIFKPADIQTASIYKPITTQMADKNMTLLDRLQASSSDSNDRLHWWVAGILSVIESPWVGPLRQEYIGSLFGKETEIVLNNPDRRKPFAHNSYINPGIHIGIIGWVVVLFYLAMVKNIFTQVFTAATKETQEKFIFQGVSITLLAPMLNAMFQNESIFTGEPTNVCLTGLLISCYQIVYSRSSVKLNNLQ